MTYITNEHIVEELRAHNRWRCGGDGPATNAQRLTALIDAACAELDRVRWRDIATAPVDFEKFNAWIVADDGGEWCEQDCYIDEEGDIRDRYGEPISSIYQWATHWMPPPRAPTPRTA